MPTVHPTLPADGDDAVVEPYNAAINLILSVLNGSLDADNLADNAVTLSKLSATVQGALTPTGALLAYGGTTPPSSSWLMCDGSSYLRAAYPALFAVIGTAYGSVDGTHFNVPDLRGRVPVGNDAMGGSAANRIQRTTTLTTTSGSNSATVGNATGIAPGMYVTNANVPAGTTITAISGTTLTLSANASGTGSAVAARFSMIGNDAQSLGSAGGEDVHKLLNNELAIHAHGLAGNIMIGSVGSSGMNAGIQSGTSYAKVGDLNDSGSSQATGNQGGDQPHNTMQPSVVTNYIIKT